MCRHPFPILELTRQSSKRFPYLYLNLSYLTGILRRSRPHKQARVILLFQYVLDLIGVVAVLANVQRHKILRQMRIIQHEVDQFLRQIQSEKRDR